MKPLTPVGAPARVALGIGFFVVFVAAWALATLGGFVSKTFLADPLTMLLDGWTLVTVHGFALDIGVTIWRVVGPFTAPPTHPIAAPARSPALSALRLSWPDAEGHPYFPRSERSAPIHGQQFVMGSLVRGGEGRDLRIEIRVLLKLEVVIQRGLC